MERLWSRRNFISLGFTLLAANTCTCLLPVTVVSAQSEQDPPVYKTQYLNELSGENWQMGQKLIGALSGIYKAINCEPVIDFVKVVDENVIRANHPKISPSSSGDVAAVVTIQNNQSTILFSRFNNPLSIQDTALHELCHLLDPEQKIVGRVLPEGGLAQLDKQRTLVMGLYRERFLMQGLFAERQDYNVLNRYSLPSIKSYLENPNTYPDKDRAENALDEAEKEAFAEFGKNALMKPDESRQRFPEFAGLFGEIYLGVSGLTLDEASQRI